jgi:hypothetical protein
MGLGHGEKPSGSEEGSAVHANAIGVAQRADHSIQRRLRIEPVRAAQPFGARGAPLRLGVPLAWFGARG